MKQYQPGRALLYYRSWDTAEVLEIDGAFDEHHLENGDDAFESLNMCSHEGLGLFVLDGFIRIEHGEEPDILWEGELRRLTTWEMTRLRYGMRIFRDD